ncbi:hypothetical protein ACFVWX_19505 [Streptomyces sp. NPDC058220]
MKRSRYLWHRADRPLPHDPARLFLDPRELLEDHDEIVAAADSP